MTIPSHCLTIEAISIKKRVEALPECNKENFPCIHFLLQIFCTLPVFTATTERSFSIQKQLKIYL